MIWKLLDYEIFNIFLEDIKTQFIVSRIASLASHPQFHPHHQENSSQYKTNDISSHAYNTTISNSFFLPEASQMKNSLSFRKFFFA